MNAPKTALFVCSSGGHLIDLREIRDAFEGMQRVMVSYVALSPDHRFVRTYTVANPFSLKRFFLLMRETIRILLKERPAVIVSAGSEVTIPFFYIGKLLGAKLVYLECCAQVYSLSITGRAVYPVADLFLVQWPGLAGKKYPKARYVGGLL